MNKVFYVVVGYKETKYLESKNIKLYSSKIETSEGNGVFLLLNSSLIVIVTNPLMASSLLVYSLYTVKSDAFFSLVTYFKLVGS